MTTARETLALLALAGAIAVAGCKQTENDSPGVTAEAATASSAASAANKSEAAKPDSVVVYYFHSNRRCRTCVGIQKTITKTIDERFGEEIASGALEFKEINIDEPENAHFVKDFDLSFSSMVVAAKKGDKTLKWQNCQEVWPLARDEAKLAEYAEKQIRSHLELLQGT